MTIVGGTVGGYITFAGAHRLIDAGIHGRESLARVTRSAALGIGVASLMRILLFLATLGVILGVWVLVADARSRQSTRLRVSACRR